MGIRWVVVIVIFIRYLYCVKIHDLYIIVINDGVYMIAVHAFVNLVSMSFSVDATLLHR